MTLNQLIYFQKLAETGHMGHTAEKLFISEPALSTGIAKLEAELGLALFERKGRRLFLSQDGAQLLVHVNRIIQELEETRQHMNRLAWQHEVKIRLGCITPVIRDFFPGKMHAFLQQPENKSVEFEYSIANTDELVRRLKNGLYDLLICSKHEDKELVQIPILAEPVLLIFAEGKEPLRTWEEIAAAPLIGYEIDSVMDRYLNDIAGQEGIRLHFTGGRGPTESAIASLVEYGFGYALVPCPEALVRSYRIQTAALPSGSHFRNIYLTVLQGHRLTGAAERFAAFLKE